MRVTEKSIRKKWHLIFANLCFYPLYYERDDFVDVKQTLIKLCKINAISGRENELVSTIKEITKPFAKSIKIDNSGNLLVALSDKKPLLMLEAHIDQIGLIVTHISDNGFIKVSAVGGIDRRMLSAKTVTVHGKHDVHGIISTLPPHVTKEEDMNKNPKIEDIVIDVAGVNVYTPTFGGGVYAKKIHKNGIATLPMPTEAYPTETEDVCTEKIHKNSISTFPMPTAAHSVESEDINNIISVGDSVTFNSSPIELLNNTLAYKSVDNRAGVVAVLKALELISKSEIDIGICAAFTVQEEVGNRGSSQAAWGFEPDYAVAVDVSFAHTPDSPAYKCGKMGKGPMLGIAPSLDMTITDILFETAKKAGIPYQTETMGGKTGTNADNIGISRAGIKTGLVSIPIKYMHTTVETVMLEDIENTAKLLSKIRF